MWHDSPREHVNMLCSQVMCIKCVMHNWLISVLLNITFRICFNWILDVDRFHRYSTDTVCLLSLYYSPVCVLNRLQAAACHSCDYATLDENESKQWKTYSRCASSYKPPLVGCSAKKTECLMKAYVPKCVILMLAIVKICYSWGYVFVPCVGALPFQCCFVDSLEGKREQRNIPLTLFLTVELTLKCSTVVNVSHFKNSSSSPVQTNAVSNQCF